MTANACENAGLAPVPIPGRTDPAAIHVSSNVLRDGQGRQLLFRGYNAKINGIFDATFDDGRAPNEVFPDFDEASAEKLEELGFDVVRLTINWSALEPHPREYSPAFFSKVDTMLDMAHRHHFYVILDMHQDAYSKEIGEDGAPLWAIVPPPTELLSGPSDDSRRLSPEVLSAGENFFANAQATDGRPLIDAFVSAVTTMAQRYTFDPAVLGFEAFNEPVVFSQDELDAFHARLADALHVIDKDAPLLFEPIATRNQFDHSIIPTTPFLHAPGVYAVHIYTGIFSNVPGWQTNLSLLDPSMTNAVAEAAGWQAPLFVTEFGCDQSQSLGPDWLSHELDLQDQTLTSSTAWAWEPGSWGIRYWDASNKLQYWPDTVSVMSRPYPRAVAGDIISIERPTPQQMIVHYRAYDSVATLPHEVSASSDYFSSFAITCDGIPIGNVTRSLGRATFTCPYSLGEHTFEIAGDLVTRRIR